MSSLGAALEAHRAARAWPRLPDPRRSCLRSPRAGPTKTGRPTTPWSGCSPPDGMIGFPLRARPRELRPAGCGAGRRPSRSSTARSGSFPDRRYSLHGGGDAARPPGRLPRVDEIQCPPTASAASLHRPDPARRGLEETMFLGAATVKRCANARPRSGVIGRPRLSTLNLRAPRRSRGCPPDRDRRVLLATSTRSPIASARDRRRRSCSAPLPADAERPGALYQAAGGLPRGHGRIGWA